MTAYGVHVSTLIELTVTLHIRESNTLLVY